MYIPNNWRNENNYDPRLAHFFTWQTSSKERILESSYSLKNEVSTLRYGNPTIYPPAKQETPASVDANYHTYIYSKISFRGKTSDEATDDVINVQIPAIKKNIAEGKLHVDNIDVFCEKGVFDVEQSRRILQAGQDAGWQLNFHGDELSALDGAKVIRWILIYRIL